MIEEDVGAKRVKYIINDGINMTFSDGGGSGFLFHPPATTADADRPAYGGTCYSNFQVGETFKVTAYDSAGVTATVSWVATATNDQVYAHPIDGFQNFTSVSAGTRKDGLYPLLRVQYD